MCVSRRVIKQKQRFQIADGRIKCFVKNQEDIHIIWLRFGRYKGPIDNHSSKMSSTLGNSHNPFQTTKYNLACAVLLTKALAQLAEGSWMNSNRKIPVRIKGWKCQENLTDCNLFRIRLARRP